MDEYRVMMVLNGVIVPSSVVTCGDLAKCTRALRHLQSMVDAARHVSWVIVPYFL